MKFFFLQILLLIALVNFGQDLKFPPPALKIPKLLNIKGNLRIDNYYWLKNKDSINVLEYLNAENNYAKESLLEIDTLTKKIRNEFTKDYIIPRKVNKDKTDSIYNGIIISYKRKLGARYPTVYKRKISSFVYDSLIDINAIATGHKYFLYKLTYSPDRKIMTIVYDTTGNELYQCDFIDIKSGKKLNESLKNITDHYEWSTRRQCFFYITTDSLDSRWSTIKMHKIGTAISQDPIVYFEKNTGCNVYITKDETEKLLLFNSDGRSGFAQQYIEVNKPFSKIQKIQAYSDQIIFVIKPYRNSIYILTNYKAKTYRILKTSLKRPDDLDNCQEIIPANSKVIIENFYLLNDFLIIQERINGLPAVRTFNLKNEKINNINFSESTYSVELNIANSSKDTLEIKYSSPIEPQIIIHFNLKTNAQTISSYKTSDTLLFNTKNYVVKRVFSKSTDGSEIPITLFYRNNIKLNHQNPLLLEAYGAYGHIEEDGFNRFLIPLVDRGFIYGSAHVRGGGEFGEEWYEQGRNIKKKNSIEDFISCSEYLIEKGYTSPNKLFITGGSAGGVTIGGAFVFKPDLYRGVFLRAPFLDVITTMADSTLPHVKIGYPEWGNPWIQNHYEAMLSYSPYDNIKNTSFPSIFIRSSYNDNRVMYWEAAKFTAKLRENQQNKTNKIFLITDMNAGHLRTNFFTEKAQEYAYMLNLMGIKK